MRKNKNKPEHVNSDVTAEIIRKINNGKITSKMFGLSKIDRGRFARYRVYRNIWDVLGALVVAAAIIPYLLTSELIALTASTPFLLVWFWLDWHKNTISRNIEAEMMYETDLHKIETETNVSVRYKSRRLFSNRMGIVTHREEKE